jgi:large exoprotein involved in heme utilization and adhesion
MSWTATLKSATLDTDGSLNSVSVISFSNGTVTLPDDTERGLDSDGLVAYVAQKVNALNHIDSMAAYVASPPLGVITIPTPPARTQADIDYANFSKWLSLTNSLAAAKTLGWVTGSEGMIVNVKNQVMALAAANIPKLFS